MKAMFQTVVFKDSYQRKVLSYFREGHSAELDKVVHQYSFLTNYLNTSIQNITESANLSSGRVTPYFNSISYG